ncbi:hypothetical protein SAMN05428976_11018 [Clostridium sp. USBA 49]|uniref:hypothetical protein n=1 Tax=Clostridium sp. USBA 49 TaxID=1881060 RepID=UPI000999400D|nr:hypothetical protein [Clostridium sp. USBA 49]SKA87582.1 hypothetical protein SAMN05428976_11018 [Clostridium sp. USBA 49]
MAKNKNKKIIFILVGVLLVIGLAVYISLKFSNKNVDKIGYTNNQKINENKIIENNTNESDNEKSNIVDSNTDKKNTDEKNTDTEVINNDNSDKEEVKESKDKDSSNKTNSKITSEDAEKIVNKYVGGDNFKIECEYDHNDKRDGIEYYVIHAYEKMEDHVATIGWYYVNVNTGEAYEWDLIKDELIPLK